MQAMKKDIHLTGRDLMDMVQLRPQDIGKYAIIPGPKDRLDNLVSKLDNPVKNFSFMEYSMYTGTYNGITVTAINGGRFSADTGITTEILCNAQAQHLIRIGSCGALREDINVGDLIIATSALRGDGVTPYYVDADFQPAADTALTDTLSNAAQQSGIPLHTGMVWSTDALLRETREHVGNAVDKGAIAVDMVTSVFLTLASVYKVKAAAILAVSDNLITGQMGFMDPMYYMAEGSMVSIALKTIMALEGKK